LRFWSGGAVYADYGTLSPGDALRETTRRQDGLAHILPNGVVDAVIESKVGPLSTVAASFFWSAAYMGQPQRLPPHQRRNLIDKLYRPKPTRLRCKPLEMKRRLPQMNAGRNVWRASRRASSNGTALQPTHHCGLQEGELSVRGFDHAHGGEALCRLRSAFTETRFRKLTLLSPISKRSQMLSQPKKERDSLSK
jgi:hypothetical protein